MAKKGPKSDLNELAKQIVDEATNDAEPTTEDPVKAAARELGRRGGLKGGKARAAKLSPKRRSEIAAQAARARWKGAKNDE